jgi:ribosomal-protein-alanine N-acetyltransferase
MRLTLPLQTERLVIKQFTEQDEESYYQLLSDQDYIKYLGSPVTHEQANRQLQRVIEGYGSSGLGSLMAYEESSSRVIGLCGLDYDQSGEDIGIFYAIRPQFRRQGYATEIARKLIDSAFKVLKVDRVVARVNSDNAASVCILKKLGMTYFKLVPYSLHDQKEHLYVLDKEMYMRLKNS